MRVKCTKLPLRGNGRPEAERWLTLGREYDVLCMSTASAEGVLLRVIGNDRQTPALFPGELFDVTDQSIPANWVVTKQNENGFVFGPRTWAEPGYWERYFDGDREAREVFKQELFSMTQEDDRRQ